MSDNLQFSRGLITTPLIFLFAGPIIGFLLFALFLTIIYFDIRGLSLFLFIPAYVMAIIIGGIPALLTGLCFEILRKKYDNKAIVICSTLLFCFTAELFYILAFGRELELAIVMSILAVFSAIILFFLFGYFKENNYF